MIRIGLLPTTLLVVLAANGCGPSGAGDAASPTRDTRDSGRQGAL